ncbi:hypothetical protein VNI00_001343 [Paramarasmius palmivorus]|uniref:Gfd2/YDR514C-like C-terminal domain-containing protein n=1 Tax=Paramarasmius palmivorus TaxID=297713 RepID=A0AAW0E9B3_9AGAR
MTVNAPIITGYYRYTDIWFEWPQVLSDSDREAVKAILAHDAIVHPDHPLHIEGVDGVQMYIGTFHSGEERLLFKSAQVDYIRYWLHAMKLTQNIIPLPYSECLLVEGSDLRYVTTRVYKDGGSLRGAIKILDKNNKKLKKGSSPRLMSRRILFDRVNKFFKTNQYAWCAMDFEGWEYDHTLITEFGYSLIYWDEGKEVFEDGHFIVKEHKGYQNTRWVTGNRDHYNFGESQIITKAEFKRRIQGLFQRLRSMGTCFLVFHDPTQDVKYLKSSSVEVDISDVSYVLPDDKPEPGLFVVDTDDLFGALVGDGENENRHSLQRVCAHLQIPTQFLHNAGNDAHYTLLACKEMAQGETLDVQRERRWPNRTGSDGTLRVDFSPYENDDWSDQEDLLGA